MKSFVTPDFRRDLRTLPTHIQSLARKNYMVWRCDSRHPSLHFKPVKPGIWSVRVGIAYRALGAVEGDAIVWFWIGHHTVYDSLIRGR